MDHGLSSRTCRAVLIRYRVVLMVGLILCITGYWSSQIGLLVNTTPAMDDMNNPSDHLRQQILNEVDAKTRSAEEKIQADSNMELVVQDTSALNEEMNRDVYYHINTPNMCNTSTFETNEKSKKIFLLIYIVTSSDKFVQRTRIRNTWGKVTYYSSMQIRTLFVISDLPNIKDRNGSALRDAVSFEASTYGDLVQEDCSECRRQTKPGPRGTAEVLRSWSDLLAFRWISEYCSDASFILRTEDDVFVNLYTLVIHLKLLHAANMNNRLLMCDVMEKLENIKAKKPDPGKQNDVILRRYCSPVSHILSQDVAAALLEASYHAPEPTRYTDEYYITSLLPSLLGPEPLTLTSMTPAYCLNREMSAYTHETEWYKYVFTRLEDKTTVNVLHIWKGLTVRARTGVIPQLSLLAPGVLADNYIPRQRLLTF